MKDVLGWGVILLVLAVPFVFAATGVVASLQQRAGKASAPSSGGLLGIDELFHPSGHNARIAWDVEQELPIPAPSPDKGPGIIEEDGRIVIEVAGKASEQ